MNNIEDATLDDVGRKVEGLFLGMYRNIIANRSVSMMIKAPKGRLILFDSDEPTAQAEAIKLFMGQHRKDK